MKKLQAEPICPAEISKAIEGLRLGKVVRIDEKGQVFVDYTGNRGERVLARYTSSVKLKSLREASISGQEILIAFEDNDPLRPIIIDTISSLLDELVEIKEVEVKMDEPRDVILDGKKITLAAKDEIEIKCGKGSIALYKDGKIVIRGTRLLSRSSGSNRIKGASVNIN